MGGIASNPQLQNAMNTRPQQPGLTNSNPGGLFSNALNQTMPGVGTTYGLGGQPYPGQMPPFQRPLPEGFQSPYANYGFDSGFQNYLDQRYYNGLGMDGGHLEYNPTNQTFTTVGGMKAPGSGPDLPSSLADVMYGYQHPLQPPTMPLNKPGTFNPFDRPGQPQVMPQQPVPMPGQVRPPNMPFYRNPNPITYGAVNNNGVTAQTPMPQPPQQRGLGGLQLNKFRNRLG